MAKWLDAQFIINSLGVGVFVLTNQYLYKELKKKESEKITK